MGINTQSLARLQLHRELTEQGTKVSRIVVWGCNRYHLSISLLGERLYEFYSDRTLAKRAILTNFKSDDDKHSDALWNTVHPDKPRPRTKTNADII